MKRRADLPGSAVGDCTAWREYNRFIAALKAHKARSSFLKKRSKKLFRPGRLTGKSFLLLCRAL
jgi:hypothetical protein